MPQEIVGHAIVSVDGKIAGADGTVPPALRNDADWRRFQAQLDRSDLVVLGRQGHERFPNPGRRRLVATRSVFDLVPDPADPLATLWNPAVVTFSQAAVALGVSSGVIAVAGVFDLFVELFTAFDLAEAQTLLIADGLPCFSLGHPRAVLSGHGLVPQQWQVLDTTAQVTLTQWHRLTQG